MMHRIVPCITRSRGGNGGHYVTKLDRFLTVEEMGALQGVPADAVAKMLESVDNDRVTVGKALGDAMSINVIMRVFCAALHCAGLSCRQLKDHWALDGFEASKGMSLPDALYKRV